jgi:acyl carrier protein
MVFDKVKSLIAQQLEVEEGKIDLDTYFTDLGADSLDVMEMIMAFENEFDMEVSEDALESIKQVKDVVDYFESH